ncbi:hypothetical protein [Streptomyces xanthophaeus]
MGTFSDFSLLGAPPTDPAYLRFVEGLKAHIETLDTPERWRWQPSNGYWHQFRFEGWILEDVSISPTPSPVDYQVADLTPQGFTYTPTMPSSFELPPLYQAITNAHAQFKGRFPYAVWSGRTGQWRNPVKRPPGSGYTRSPDVDEGGLPYECRQRIARVREAVVLEYITRDEGARLISAIIDEYT